MTSTASIWTFQARAPHRSRDDGVVRDEELIVDFALARLDHPDLDLEEIAALLVRRMSPAAVVGLAARSLADRDELRGGAFEAAVECVLRVVFRLRDAEDS
jgi:hypothetical protein